MFKVNSQRAQKTLAAPKFMKKELGPGMKKYPSDALNLWAHIDWEHGNVKSLSFFGEVSDGSILILESMAHLLIGKNISFLGDLSIRECEAFLRDRNSQMAFEGMDESEENELKKFFTWLKSSPLPKVSREYHFHLNKGPFETLKLVDKVRELKAFLNSPEVFDLYQEVTPPELIDVEDLTVYLKASYQSEKEKSLFEELHQLGVETFGEEKLNFIPED